VDRRHTEAKFSQEVVQFFRDQLAETRWGDGTEAQERVKIMKDFTIGVDRESAWRLIAGFQQQDIGFYAPTQIVPMDQFRSAFMRIDKYDRTGRKPIVIPLLICELKVGSSVNTHGLITYSSISTQLKGVFRHCAYYFVLDSSQERSMNPETVLRHAKGFDCVFLDWDREQAKVWEAIEAHFRYLEGVGLMPQAGV
jgi:hypothetical protein